jgi:hypothetical protein
MKSRQDRNGPAHRCPECHRPLKLINRIPALGVRPELLIFHCSPCDEVELKYCAEGIPSPMTVATEKENPG